MTCAAKTAMTPCWRSWAGVGPRRAQGLALQRQQGALGSHVDRHTHIGEGEIYEDGFGRILNGALARHPHAAGDAQRRRLAETSEPAPPAPSSTTPAHPARPARRRLKSSPAQRFRRNRRLPRDCRCRFWYNERRSAPPDATKASASRPRPQRAERQAAPCPFTAAWRRKPHVQRFVHLHTHSNTRCSTDWAAKEPGRRSQTAEPAGPRLTTTAPCTGPSALPRLRRATSIPLSG